MKTNYNTYQSNILWDYNFPVKIFKGEMPKLSPLKTGARINSLSIPQDSGIWQNVPEQFNLSNPTIRQIIDNKPLTISFLSGGWNEYGLKHLQTLKQSYAEILALGGNLLVVVQASYKDTLELAGHFELPFNLLADPNNLLAKQFGIYTKEVALWERIAGISEDVPAPATYVLNQHGKIVYHSVDTDFSRPFSATEMLGAVFSACHQIPYSVKYSLAA
ncbi:Peroxiredoxin [Pseudarcicella hirudinis]|uniref:Peroxiredoxin n=1 Tax=Pseudarcicella hirudinis TaxID=1079859 RepID=A0A1I5YVY2_9BACT|nr:redoxin domain-containing protein [Pseudarcicella hirudinis]SFQ48389.1 Peroxiredoxin [Pseudarcicella hirudinis]